MASSNVTVHPAATHVGRSADMALVERCRRGEVGAFEEIYRAYSPKLYGLVLRMVHNQADADDLLQEIFLTAYRKLESFRGDAALGTWLYRLATNQCLDHLRSRTARTGQVTDPLDDEPTLAEGATRSFAEQSVTKLDLERAVAQLPDGCRAAFLLHDVHGLEHREVAQALGVAEGTSKSQVHKARLRLRSLLAGVRRTGS